MNGTTAMNGIKLNKTFIKEINENPGELCQCIVLVFTIMKLARKAEIPSALDSQAWSTRRFQVQAV